MRTEIHNKVSIYPNPTEGNLRLELLEKSPWFSIDILHLTGQVVFSEKFSNTNKASISLKADAGVYILQMADNLGRMQAVKIIKK